MSHDASLYNTQEVLQLLQMQQLAPDRFLGQSHFMGSPNVFGGQALGQALYAAGLTVPERRPHSMHALFILPGDHRLPIEYEVERVRDGGSFSTRRVVATQEGRRMFVMSASFQTLEDGLSHQKTMPAHRDPETLPSTLAQWRERSLQSGSPFNPAPVDFRIDREVVAEMADGNGALKQVWTRAPGPLPDAPLLHESLFAYTSDYGLLWTALQPHDVRISDPRLQLASLDHTIWFHRPFRMDEWLLFSMESPNASGGRGLCFAHIYREDGALVATVTQEGLIRLRDKPAR
ncbi:acyl-CoA thioesterase II [uncultured Oxalicibacterium sp.]|uniref:acyl-CoA thioesterase n=1 Tax=uncultured Oxalicibacterium sp. TaxID=1168540 RepID=UPI0025E8D09A|nr:acyl-CoA thioesterase II [uncultured Oxalicibacterium sp.]